VIKSAFASHQAVPAEGSWFRGRRVAPTALRFSARGRVAELASLTAFVALKQLRRVSPRSALRAPTPGLRSSSLHKSPPAGTACRGAKALESKAGIARCNTKALEPLPGTVRRDAKAQNPPAVAARRDAQAQALVIRGRSRSAFEAHEQAFPQQDFMRRVARETWRSN